MDARFISIATILVAALFIFSACSKTPGAQDAGTTPAAPADTPTTPPAPEAAAGEPPSTGTGAAAAHTVEVSMTAKGFKFSPDVIRAKQGDRVVINVLESDDDHGLAIQGYNKQVKFGEGTFAPGQVSLDFIADKTGTFKLYCNVPCGPGHREMTGQLIVE
jgi:heme/copper-type cytochrome/quinol oxidase subunit 2